MTIRGLAGLPLTASLVLASTLMLAACTSPDRPSVQADDVALPTPMRTVGASVQRTIMAVESALGAIGERLTMPTSSYRPSEPPALLRQDPRVQPARKARPGTLVPPGPRSPVRRGRPENRDRKVPA